MGTAAFDAAWGGDPTKPKKSTALDALWDAPAPAPAPSNDIHAQYRSGLLAKRMQRENQNDQEAASVDEPSSTLGAFGRSLAATGANIAQGIPGMEAAEAGARSLFRRQPYREALSDIRGATGQIPGALRTVERIAGAAPLAGILPGSPALSGAIIGGADQALNADPDQSLLERGLRTGAGAIGGAAVGKMADAAFTGARALLPSRLGGSQSPAALLLMKQAQRASSAKSLYGAALSEGKSHEATQAVKSFLADPDIQDIVSGLQQTDQFARLSPESPEMLDAVYKTLSDQAKQARKGLAAANPTKANQGRFNLQNIVGKQRKLMEALGSPGEKPALSMDVAPEVYESAPRVMQAERPTMQGPVGSGTLASNTTSPLPPRGFTPMQGPAGPAFQLRGQSERVAPGVRIETPAMRVQTAPAQPQPAMMPTYKYAVDDYAKRTAEIEAIKRGYDTYRSSLSGNLPTANNLTRKTPEAFAEWAGKASPVEVAGARQGILGGAKMGTHFTVNPFKGFGIPDAITKANTAAKLLREGRTTPQAYIEILHNLGLLTAGNATSP